MQQRLLGNTGITVSRLGFGCGNVGGLMVRGEPAAQREAVARALDGGITYFDTAPQYGGGRSEANLGRVLSELHAWDQVTVGTKVRLSTEDRGDPAGAIRRSLETSLRLLGREHVDLVQLHNPIGSDAGAGMVSVDEVLGEIGDALRLAIQSGLARHAGVTGLGETAAIHQVVGSGRFATVQTYCNAVNPSAAVAGASAGGQDFAGLLGAADAAGMGVIVIRMMAAGALSGTIERPPLAGGAGGALAQGGTFAADQARADRLRALVRDGDIESTTELAVRFVLSLPAVSTALVGFSNLDQVEQALGWAERGPLDRNLAARIVEVAKDHLGWRPH